MSKSRTGYKFTETKRSTKTEYVDPEKGVAITDREIEYHDGKVDHSNRRVVITTPEGEFERYEYDAHVSVKGKCTVPHQRSIFDVEKIPEGYLDCKSRLFGLVNSSNSSLGKSNNDELVLTALCSESRYAMRDKLEKIQLESEKSAKNANSTTLRK